jgi:hypothetical protein
MDEKQFKSYVFEKSEDPLDCLKNINKILNDICEYVDSINNRLYFIEDKLKNLKLEKVASSFQKFNSSYMTLIDREEDYLKNQEKCNQMINELKGVVSMSRASLSDRKNHDHILLNNLQVYLDGNLFLVLRKYFDEILKKLSNKTEENI